MRHFKIDSKYGVIDIMKDKSYKYGIEKTPPTPPTPPFLLTIGKLKPPLIGNVVNLMFFVGADPCVRPREPDEYSRRKT